MANRRKDQLTPELIAKEARVVEMVEDGYSYEEIAAEVGYANKGAVSVCYWRAIKRYPAEKVAEHRQSENIKLDALEVIIGDIVQTGDDEMKLKGIDRFMKVMDRRAKLNGLDAPTKTDLTSGGEKVTIQVVPDWMPEGIIEQEEVIDYEDDGED